ncbi:sugar phosphate isomerase/epimerase family protein, partial [Sinorhizobium meliloti]
PPGDTSTARTVGHLCESAGLKTSYGSYVAPPTDDLSALAPALATAVALGASNIRIWPGTRQRASRDYSADEWRDAADAIRDMGAEAARHGITVSLEYHPQTLTDETSSALRLIEAVAHPNVYLYWQPRPGLPLVEALTEIASIGAHVSHVHVFAWDRERKRFPLASAEGYWQAALAAMPQSRWTGRRFAMLEFVAGDDPAAFLADAATLRKILKAEFPPGASAIADRD